MIIYVRFHLNLFWVILLLNNVPPYNIIIIRFTFLGLIYCYFSSNLKIKIVFIFISVFNLIFSALLLEILLCAVAIFTFVYFYFSFRLK